MADQLPIICRTRAVNATATPSTSLIGRGLSAIQRKETGIARTELEARYKQARDIYNRITNYGLEDRFDFWAMPNQGEQFDLFEDNQMQPFFTMLQQLADVFTVFKQLADQGYGKAYSPLASMYWRGQGIRENIDKADYYSRLAYDWCFASQALDDPEIWRDLSQICENGRGIEHDDEQSVFWIQYAAEQGYLWAQCTLGWMYEYGKDVEQNDEQAVFWYRKAAEQGYIEAQYHLGLMYEDSSEQDDEQAVFWNRKAAEQGHADAQAHLAWCYAFAEGVEQDDKQAIFWLLKADEQGNVQAQNNLDWIYAKIICSEDYHKSILMERFGVTDIQAEAIQELKLKLLAKLEEIKNILEGQSDDWYVFVSHFGYGFRIQLKELLSKNHVDKLLIMLLDDTKALKPVPIRSEADLLAVVTLQGRLLIFPVIELPTLANGKDNKLIQIPTWNLGTGNDYVVAAVVLPENGQLKIIAGGGKRQLTLRCADIEYYSGSRGISALSLPLGFHRVEGLESE